LSESNAQERGYYTVSEILKLLSLSKANFFRKVANGELPRAMKHGQYSKADYDTLARAQRAVFTYFDRMVFSRSTIAEQEQEMHIGIRCFGMEFITPFAERIAFQQKVEFTFWSLKVLGKVVGYVSMFRFPDEFLDDLLTGRKIEREITLKEVLPFTRLEPFTVYVDVLAVDPTLPLHERVVYAGIIVERFANKILDLRANGYVIEKLYTVSSTPEGDTLVQKVGFHRMEGKSLAPGRIAYQFPLDEQGVKRLWKLTRRDVQHE